MVRIPFGDGVDLPFKQVGAYLLIRGDCIRATLLDVEQDEFLAADVIDFI